MIIRKFLVGMTAAAIAAMTTAAVSASAISAAAPAANNDLKVEKARSSVYARRSINHDITDGTVDYEEKYSKDGSIAVDPVDSSIPLVMIVAEFPNVSYDTEADWADITFENEFSLSQFYKDMSNNKFTFTPAEETSAAGVDGNKNTADEVNDGVIHVSIEQEHGNWAGNPDDLNDANMLRALKEAIEKAGDFIDYKSFDTNGNGMIDTQELAIGIVVAGYEGAATGDNEGGDDFWAHQWSFDENAVYDPSDPCYVDYPEADGVKLNRYIGIGEHLAENKLSGVNVISHELGHFIGLADYYDVDYLKEGDWIGYTPDIYSVMDNGVWCATDSGDYRTLAMDTVSKMILGWANTEVVSESGEYEIKAEDYTTAEGEHKALVIPTSTEGEYYVLEVRNNNKWDELMKRYVPETVQDGGIVLYHVDERVWGEECYKAPGYTNGDYNTINVPVHRPAITPLYLEVTKDGIPAILGDYLGFDTCAEGAESDAARIALYSKSMWDIYGTDYIGPELELPMYGLGDAKDDKSARILSGIKIEFLDDVSDTMHVKITLPEEEPTPSEPDSSSEPEPSTPDSSSEPEPSTPDTTSSTSNDTNSKITDTPVANTGAGAGLAAVAAVVTGALITVVSRKRNN